MKNIPKIELESSAESRYGEEISELEKKLAELKSKLKAHRRNLELAELRVRNIPVELEHEKKTGAEPSHLEAEFELMRGLKKSQGAIVKSLEEEIKKIERSIEEDKTLEERFRDTPRAKA